MLADKLKDKSIKVEAMLDFFKCGHSQGIPIYHPKNLPEESRNLNIIFTDPMIYPSTADNLRKIWNYSGDFLTLQKEFPFIDSDEFNQTNEKAYNDWMIRAYNL